MPTSRLALQVSAGHLTEAEHDTDVNRVTASAMYHRIVSGKMWASTLAWGVNREPDESAPAWLVESALDVTSRDLVFGRLELVEKSGHDLVLPASIDGSFTVTKAQAGYTRWLSVRRMRSGVGGSVGISFLPAALEPIYGRRSPVEISLFVTIRPR
jgi:hypothetical protein